MDIVAENLSANTLKARNVTVGGKDVLKWFESKLSASVSFAGVFDDLSAAPLRNGAVAIVGSKDYIYSSTTSAWQEFGDEGQIGILAQAVRALSDELSCYAKKDEVSSVSAVSQLLNDVGYLSVESEPAFAAVSATFLTAYPDLSGYYQKTETSSAAEIQTALSGKQPLGNYLTGEEEPAFAAVSSTFLTAHQDLSGYYTKPETSSSAELSLEFNAFSQRISALEQQLSGVPQKLDEILG